MVSISLNGHSSTGQSLQRILKANAISDWLIILQWTIRERPPHTNSPQGLYTDQVTKKGEIYFFKVLYGRVVNVGKSLAKMAGFFMCKLAHVEKNRALKRDMMTLRFLFF